MNAGGEWAMACEDGGASTAAGGGSRGCAADARGRSGGETGSASWARAIVVGGAGGAGADEPCGVSSAGGHGEELRVGLADAVLRGVQGECAGADGLAVEDAVTRDEAGVDIEGVEVEDAEGEGGMGAAGDEGAGAARDESRAAIEESGEIDVGLAVDEEGEEECGVSRLEMGREMDEAIGEAAFRDITGGETRISMCVIFMREARRYDLGIRSVQLGRLGLRSIHHEAPPGRQSFNAAMPIHC